MATLVFGALGTLIGGPLGGALGALAGRQVDSIIFGGGNRQGPRLKELAPTASSYGVAIPRHFGRMRVPGSIIWATDLVEHEQTEGGGKGRPSVTTYTYTASFAVALSSRPIRSVGRIWADGNLLRGAAGDLKASGTYRLYTGEGDQDADPLMVEVEGEATCPAYRGLAYAVFEDLDLGEFYNRIPSLTFEVIADDGPFTVQTLLEDVFADAEAGLALPGITGFTCEGPLSETLEALDPIFPMDCDASGDQLVIARERLQAASIVLPEAAISVDDGDFGGRTGYARKREPHPLSPPEVLRYYDVDRDYQPGLQRATGRPGPGQPRTVELPAALTAVDARNLVEAMAKRANWARDTLAWRTTEMDPNVTPGALVNVPGQLGLWRVTEWEWRDRGIEFALSRVEPAGINAAATVADPGRTNPPGDRAVVPTWLAAFELPWDGTGNGDASATFAAATAANSSWSGAALYVDHGDGQLLPLGSTGRTRCLIGTAAGVLGIANPLLFDRANSVIVTLVGADMTLPNATPRQMAMGANRALLGKEIIQFAQATPLGDGRWKLSGLLRGRGGTEYAVAGHVADEPFVLLDGKPTALDPQLVGAAQATLIAAIGLGDTTAVTSPIALQGITLRPLAPVHPRSRTEGDGSMVLEWTRRARGAVSWLDGVDAPLHEQSEAYIVSYGPLAAPVAVWQVAEPALTLSPVIVATLSGQLAGGVFHVRQQGTYALSDPLELTHLT